MTAIRYPAEPGGGDMLSVTALLLLNKPSTYTSIGAMASLSASTPLIILNLFFRSLRSPNSSGSGIWPWAFAASRQDNSTILALSAQATNTSV
ncbi:unnamed protein product, partial [Iphiclides podalirius]